jgi:hypothetical protein
MGKRAAPLFIAGAGVAIAIFAPFRSWGESIRPGLGDLLNGGTALALLAIGGIWAAQSLKRPSR